MTEKGVIKTTLNVPRKLWCKIKVLAGEKGLSANDLVVNTLKEKYGKIEVVI
jgi:hypothetical protein